ncbi:MAG: DUF2339 domain-containing protein [Flavobacteriales bacterium]|nr:DUF2339 domain-containing protein [Flavobacteriales bacterium]
MEAIITIIVLAILAVPVVLLVWIKVSTSNSIRDVGFKVNNLSYKIDQLRDDIVTKKVDDLVVEEEIDQRVERMLDIVPEEKEEKQEDKPEAIEQIEEVREELIDTAFPAEQSETRESSESVEEELDAVRPEKYAAFAAASPQEAKPVTLPKPPKKKRDLEKFVGENLLNKIGIGVLVLGIAYFVKYAIDNNWIGEVGRVAIGLLSGGLLSFIAHKIRKSYKAFSSVLVGGAMAVFYYTISIAFHDYHLFSQPLAFGLMVGVTAFSVLLSISYDKKELAILALVGAFSTPLMLSTGEGNYKILFTYITIVNVGMLVLAYFRKWNLVNILSLSFTILLYGSWFMVKVVNGVAPVPYRGALIFAGIFYLVFFFMHIVNNLKERTTFKHYEFGLLLGTTALFYTVGMSVFHLSGNAQYQGLFTVLLGVFNLLFAYPLYKRNNVDRSLIFLLMGMVLTFVSLAAPVQLSGNHITMFWVSEMVLLLWLGQKSGLKLVKSGAIILMVLMGISLVMDWGQIYFAYPSLKLPVIVNKGFITTAFAVLGLILFSRLLNREEEGATILGMPVPGLRSGVKMLAGALIYIMGMLEISYQVQLHLGKESLTVLSGLLWTLAFVAGLIVYAQKLQSRLLQQVLVITSLVTVMVYPVFNFLEQNVRNEVLYGQLNSFSVVVNYLNAGLVILLAVWFIRKVKQWYGFDSANYKAAVWIMSLFGIMIFSMQLNHQTIMLFYDAQLENMSFINKQTVKIGYPILWGLSSFGLMLIGMRKKQRVFRIISLSLFALVLFKLFLFDIQGASEAGKIVAFILLGVLLLVISFMYQKLKNLILEDHPDQIKNMES